MKRGEGFIDWNTAEIAADRNSELPTLTVEVTGDLGIHWRNSFQSYVQIYNQGQQHRPRPWGNVSMESAGGTMSKTIIQVEEIQSGAEADLKEQLDHFAKQATAAAIPREEKEDRLRAERQEQAQDKANQMAEMQDRFRAA